MSIKQLDTDEQKVSYGFGLQFGQQLLKNQFDGLDVNCVSQGIEDILKSNPILIKEAELNQAYQTIQQQIQSKMEENAKKTKELSLRFLEENAKRDGVKLTESGLQYEILESGSGEQPIKEQQVKVHYHGTLISGQVFDSSVERNDPAVFGLTQVIPGWTEILQLMVEGDKWRVTIPSELAYGDAGAPPSIPGGATLIFEIHLIEIIK